MHYTIMERSTDQKKYIMEFLENTCSHPTAEDVYFAVQKKVPHVSKGTIYRNLDLFVKKGLINEIPGEKKRFDANIDMHGHFFCEKCNALFDVCDGTNKELFVKLKKNAQQYGKIMSCDVYMRGICPECEHSKK